MSLLSAAGIALHNVADNALLGILPESWKPVPQGGFDEFVDFTTDTLAPLISFGALGATGAYKQIAQRFARIVKNNPKALAKLINTEKKAEAVRKTLADPEVSAEVKQALLQKIANQRKTYYAYSKGAHGVAKVIERFPNFMGGAAAATMLSEPLEDPAGALGYGLLGGLAGAGGGYLASKFFAPPA